MHHHPRCLKKTDPESAAGECVMGTLSERILGGTAGEYVDCHVDRAYVHDGTGVLTLEAWKNMGEMGIQDAAEVVVGRGAHTCSLGAFGAFATGVRATDMAAIWMAGETWFRVPESIGIHLSGTLSGAAEAKDLALTYVGRLGMDGATYKALEFIGDGAAALTVDERLTLCNLAVETGAKAGMFYADDVTVHYLAECGHTV